MLNIANHVKYNRTSDSFDAGISPGFSTTHICFHYLLVFPRIYAPSWNKLDYNEQAAPI